jgi:hypothetical protein
LIYLEFFNTLSKIVIIVNKFLVQLTCTLSKKASSLVVN